MIILGLGSNVGDRLNNLTGAIKLLSESVVTAITVSAVYESQAVLKADAPEEWNKPFLNMAISGETHLTPEALLTQIKCIEKRLGRNDVRLWAPREIDIDILAYDDFYVSSKSLSIPHESLCHRPFALLPLADLTPNWRFPGVGEYKGKTAYEISQALEDSSSIIQTEYNMAEILGQQLVA